jgi:hypothetical protein
MFAQFNSGEFNDPADLGNRQPLSFSRSCPVNMGMAVLPDAGFQIMAAISL